MLKKTNVVFALGERGLSLRFEENKEYSFFGLLYSIRHDLREMEKGNIRKSKLTMPEERFQLAYDLWRTLTGKYPDVTLGAAFTKACVDSECNNPQSEDCRQRQADFREVMAISDEITDLLW